MKKQRNRVGLLALAFATCMAHAQYGTGAPPPAGPQATETQLDSMSKLLMTLQQQLEETQQQLNQVRSEMDALRNRHPDTGVQSTAGLSQPQAEGIPTRNESAASPSKKLVDEMTRQQEEQEVLQAEVKQHDQIKVETLSKYPVRVYGLLLFNMYSNAGVTDNPDLPSAAIAGGPGESHGTIGASFRQTLLGLSAAGPKFLGARTAADLSIDFFSGISYSYYGNSAGNVRLRRADIQLGWGTVADSEINRDELHFGVDAPLISPLSPTSFANVAQPALAWSGNLWTWAPQLRYKHTFAAPFAGRGSSVQVEGGLWDPPVVGISGVTPARTPSAGELSRRPGVLSRASFHTGSAEHPLALGIGAFGERQTYYEGQSIQMWAVTSDWQIPLSHRFQFDGELYRGRGLGGLGGGAYKDVLTGSDVHTGLNRTVGLNAVGGWAQLKTHLLPGTEANLIYGQDGAFAADFRRLDLSSSTYLLEQSARNQTLLANFIYRPRTYLILSPEYRRLSTWKTYGPAAIANIYTLTLGYQF